ncbi:MULTISPECIES: TdeIII family type II restriction endonuclease [unclassified Coleofasciculus]|uniref:TdeIII family type II restriction endonuclease n=1 Tax=unclassified Coleofasciculus TaxID=2692782 RepID=UPI00187E2037|nr:MULTISPECIES: TdeIII family type II restriction endonuclease [unclassified Coleofasciculus]MBE9129176.1 TdeIII family type II restriction endonuclease [Coleofasciculus sp. LEGE 07081]MBE9151090.1 TdeIII family type II restriction endonuclease [Coleofasciculus sp. LEGE 07092]
MDNSEEMKSAIQSVIKQMMDKVMENALLKDPFIPEKHQRLYSMEPKQIDEAYFALPYNPYGQKENYSWSFPARWFNMKEDKVVLIGDEFWEKIGGLGTYQAFISAVNEIGQEYKNRIYREFLGIEPPTGALDFTL